MNAVEDLIRRTRLDRGLGRHIRDRGFYGRVAALIERTASRDGVPGVGAGDSHTSLTLNLPADERAAVPGEPRGRHRI